jgi:anti-anti-sigma factor
MEGQRGRSRLNVKVERSGSIIVLDLEGRLTVGADLHRLGGLTQWMSRLSGSLVILDLRGVEQLDCSGVGQLAEFHNKVHLLGGTFALVNMNDRQQCLLKVLGLLEVVPVFNNRQLAFAWFKEVTLQRATMAQTAQG